MDLQTELFQEFQQETKEEKTPASEKTNSIFNLSLLRDTKVEVPFDTVFILIIVFIFMGTTVYLMGVQTGKKISKNTVVTVEKEVIREKQPEKPIVLSKQDFDQPKVSMPTVNKDQTSVLIKPKEPSLMTTNENQATKKSVRQADVGFKKYTIQIGASKDKAAAEKEITKMVGKGYEAFLLTSTSSTGTIWYKMCVGRYGKAKEAASMMKKLKAQEGFKDSFLTHLS